MRDERGAVAVVVALLIVPLMGFAAIAIDLSAAYAQRQQLQNGADAAALAIGQACNAGSCGMPAATATAQTLARQNLNSGTSTATVSSLSSSSVTVLNSGVRAHLFAPILNVHSSDISATATATWGRPSQGTAMLPLAFSWCEWQAQTGGGMPSGTLQRDIEFPKSSTTGCTGPSGNFVPGGFGWLAVDPGTCKTTSSIGAQVVSSPGNTPSNGCNPAHFEALRGKTVLLPLFIKFGQTGNNAWYEVAGYAAFTITGYYFAGQYKWNSSCNGTQRCIHGYFTKMTNQNPTFTYGSGGPRLGADATFLKK